MKTEPNEPISACEETRRYGSEDQFMTTDFHAGLTKREYFAAMAMQGMCRTDTCLTEQQIAQYSVMQADALINELNKEK